MGSGPSKSSKKKNSKNPVDQNWEKVQNNQTYSIVRNKTDGREAEEYEYTLDNRYDPCGEAAIFQKRSKAKLPIVRAFDHQWQTKGIGMVPRNQFRVVTERLPRKLSECPQFSFDESLYILDRALEGYHFLYNSIGAFDINSNMIGFTNEGEVRVWHNENFGSNYPYHEKRTLQSTRIDEPLKLEDVIFVPLEEIEIVRNIVNVVEDRCEEGQFPEDFREVIRQNIGFIEAKRVLREELDNPERVLINRIDLQHNQVRSKISKSRNNGLRQTNDTYETSVHVRNGQSFLQTRQNEDRNFSQFQSNFVPYGQSEKNAYSLSYQKGISA